MKETINNVSNDSIKGGGCDKGFNAIKVFESFS